MADFGGLHRAPESLLALREVVKDMSTCFERSELGEGDNGLGLDTYLYNMIIKLSDVITGDIMSLFARNVERGVLGAHEQINDAVQAFASATQVLMKKVVEAEDAWDDAEQKISRIDSWKRAWYTLADLLIHLLKAELGLAKQCLARDVMSASDIRDAQFSHYQIMTHRSDAWRWNQSREELRHAASKDDRAANIVTELRVKRATDRLAISASVGEEVIANMWRAGEEEEEEESLCLKRSALVALQCLKQSNEKLNPASAPKEPSPKPARKKSKAESTRKRHARDVPVRR